MKGMNLLRLFFVVCCAVLGWQIGTYIGSPSATTILTYQFSGLALGVLLSLVIVGVEISFTKHFIGVVTSALLGLLGGLILTLLFVRIIFLLEIFQESSPGFQTLVQTALLIIFCYLGIVITLQTREKFKFIIPFMELQPEREKENELILDSNTLIDGRVKDLAQSGLLPHRFIVPSFIVQELQTLADSDDKTKRIRGRRGLNLLEELKESSEIKVVVDQASVPYAETMDEKLIQYARKKSSKILSNDYALNKVASLEDVQVINLNNIVKDMKKNVTPGEQLTVELTKEGEEENQGVGYLEDGTMVVVEDGQHHIGETVEVTISSSLETQAGQMIFAEMTS